VLNSNNGKTLFSAAIQTFSYRAQSGAEIQGAVEVGPIKEECLPQCQLWALVVEVGDIRVPELGQSSERALFNLMTTTNLLVFLFSIDLSREHCDLSPWRNNTTYSWVDPILQHILWYLPASVPVRTGSTMVSRPCRYN
jgi:hypothetical protein